jgi:hypothetical protein
VGNDIWQDACPLDFKIDAGQVMVYQPGEVRIIDPPPTNKRTTGGGIISAPRTKGRRFACRWGDEALQVGAIIELRERLENSTGSAIQVNHTLSFNEPDGTAYVDVAVHLIDSFSPRIQRPGSYEPMTLTFQETP